MAVRTIADIESLHAFMVENQLSATTSKGTFLITSSDGSAVTGKTWSDLFDALAEARSAIETSKGKDRSTVAVSIVEALQSGFFYFTPKSDGEKVLWSIFRSDTSAVLVNEPDRQSLGAVLLRIVELTANRKSR
jgi:hypothetical protein